MSGLKKLIPLMDRVLVEKMAAPTKSVGGVLLPDSAVSKVRHAAQPTASWRRLGPGHRRSRDTQTMGCSADRRWWSLICAAQLRHRRRRGARSPDKHRCASAAGTLLAPFVQALLYARYFMLVLRRCSMVHCRALRGLLQQRQRTQCLAAAAAADMHACHPWCCGHLLVQASWCL
jgi:hypothetical protein